MSHVSTNVNRTKSLQVSAPVPSSFFHETIVAVLLTSLVLRLEHKNRISGVVKWYLSISAQQANTITLASADLIAILIPANLYRTDISHYSQEYTQFGTLQHLIMASEEKLQSPLITKDEKSIVEVKQEPEATIAPNLETASKSDTTDQSKPGVKAATSGETSTPASKNADSVTRSSATTEVAAAKADDDSVNPQDFQGEVQTNNDLPTVETLRKIETYTVLDHDGKSHTFKSLYAGHNAARRVLVIFVRHFFCGVSN